MTDLDIIRQECEYFHDVKHSEFISRTREAHVVNCRQQAMYFAKNLTKTIGKEIGKYFGGRDHTTVSHSLDVVRNRAKLEKDYASKLEELEKIIKYQLETYEDTVVKMTYFRDDMDVPDHIMDSHTFTSAVEAFKYYRDNQKYISQATIEIRKQPKAQQSQFTNVPISINLKPIHDSSITGPM